VKGPRDILGNELLEGQQVMMHIPSAKLLHAMVLKVQPGGIADTNGRRSPAVVVLQCVFPFQIEPGGIVPGVFRIVSPESQRIVEQMSGVPATEEKPS
jgi:hypothetical protein